MLTKGHFEQTYGVSADDARVCTMRVDQGPQNFQGVLRQEAQAPTLILFTERTWERTVPKLMPDNHYFAEQAGNVFKNLPAEGLRNYGFDIGGKYRAKVKTTRSYTDDELKQLAARAKAVHENQPGSALAGMLEGKVATHKHVSDGEDDEGGLQEEAEAEEEAPRSSSSRVPEAAAADSSICASKREVHDEGDEEAVLVFCLDSTGV